MFYLVEGLGILNFLILLLPFLYSCIVTGSWIGKLEKKLYFLYPPPLSGPVNEKLTLYNG